MWFDKTGIIVKHVKLKIEGANESMSRVLGVAIGTSPKKIVFFSKMAV